MITERLVQLTCEAFGIVGARQRRDGEIVLRSLIGERNIDLGVRFGISRERVRQIIDRAETFGGTIPGRLAPPPMPAPAKQPIELRFLERVEVDPTTGCWNWTGYKDAKGYGVFRGYGEFYAHRFAVVVFKDRSAFKGDTRLVTDHLCRNPACVNPLHLDVVTNKENLARSPHWQDGSWVWARKGWRTRGTHCVNGHEYTAENTKEVLIKGRKARRCVACLRAAWRLPAYRRAAKRCAA